MQRLTKKINERGDIVQTILLAPFIIGLLFAIINMSAYFTVRGQIQDAAKDGARMVALYGGNNAQQTIVNNKTKKNVQDIIKDRLWQDGKCTLSYCYSEPVVTCTPERVESPGEEVSCRIEYTYAAIAPSLLPLDKWMAGTKINVEQKYVSEVGYGSK